ncbi:MAG: esterase/lipase family protein [Dehalococcoidia bacterium]
MSRARVALIAGSVLLLIGLVLAAATAPRSSAAVPSAAPSVAGRDVLLLFGWNGNTGNWNTAKAQYEASGATVHVLSLPRGGSSAGDTAVNATAVQDYIAAHGLTDVQLDGHSLGGWLALYVVLVRRDPAVTSVVLRDTGYGCTRILWQSIPGDQCAGSDMLAAIEAAAPSAVPILNLSSKTAALPQVDCLRTYNLGHNDFLTNAAVTSAAIGWPAVSPCGPAPSPTSTATPTATATSTLTATPTATATPGPVCTWWDRLWGRC